MQVPNFAFPISNVIVPVGGPKCVACSLDFSGTGTIEIDGEQIISQHAIEYIQGVFIDNADNAAAFTITCAITGHRIVCPPNSQGFFSLMAQVPKFTATTTQAGGRVIRATFYNVPIMQGTWKSI
jgi:hypothetical protein